ncbi:leucine-rich repeat transmembrane protein kinase protein [Tanacetum coccineum]
MFILAAAIWNTKSAYGLKKNWQGDLCFPQEYIWNGINCSYKDTVNPRIIYLNLSSSSLRGDIPDALANLTMIQSLDLSYNNLTGTVPKFLASLNFLAVLNLTGNNLTRPLPEELPAKSKNGSLLLSFEENSDQDMISCPKGPCKNKKQKKVVIPVIATMAAFFVLLITLAIVCAIKRRQTPVNADPNDGDGFIEPRNQSFTFLDIQSITESFSIVIRKGGFGTVFYGSIGNNQVAVKMLSESSSQGYSEFQAEVRLLMSVHHKNITSLVGYCNEGSQKGIIYEYMANGNLGMHLFDGSLDVLSWKKRLEIAYDAAQGITQQVKSMVAEGNIEKLIDPRYYTTNRLTEKSDVYSFGVVLPGVDRTPTSNIR